MRPGGDGGRNAAAEERFEALLRRVSGVEGGRPRDTAGVTEDGRYAYRYDDEGRFYAAPMHRLIRSREGTRFAFDDAPTAR